jgi:ribosomal protein S12 methylthiotransferase accessory factor
MPLSKDFLSFSSLFNTILKKIAAMLLDVINNQPANLVDNFPIANISTKTKILINNLFQKKIIKQVIKIPRIYYDEPSVINYQVNTPCKQPDIAVYSDGMGTITNSGGADFKNEEKAIMKAVGEGLERFCLCVYREKKLLLSPYSKISKKALNPLSFTGISPSQREANPRLKIDENSIFRWVEGFSLYNNKKVLIPAQLIYIGYKYHEKEPIIQQQISTGAAAAPSFSEALYRGICEAVERDSFMIAYLNKLSPPIIDLDVIDDENLQKLLKDFKERYNLELYVIDITTDISLPSMMAIIVDRTGIGPAVHVATKTSLNIRDAILGAICETVRGRISFRKISSPSSIPEWEIKRLRLNPSQIKTFADRSNFWALPEMLGKINFFFRGPKKRFSQEELSKYQDIPSGEKLKIVLNLLKQSNIDIYGVDINIPQIREEGIHIAKVVSPQLQPLYLNEAIKHNWGERLFNVPVRMGYRTKPLSENEINPLPHPFL